MLRQKVFCLILASVFVFGFHGFSQAKSNCSYIDLVDGGNHEYHEFVPGMTVLDPRHIDAFDMQYACFDITMDIANTGTSKSGPFIVQLWAVAGNDEFLLGHSGRSSVQPGGTVGIRITGVVSDQMQALWPTNKYYSLKVLIDADNDVVESDETNNEVYLDVDDITVAPPPEGKPLEMSPAISIKEQHELDFYSSLTQFGTANSPNVIAELDSNLTIKYELSNRGFYDTGSFVIEFWAFHSDSLNVANTAVHYLGNQIISWIPANSTINGTFNVSLNNLPPTKPITGNPPNAPIIPGHKYYIGWIVEKPAYLLETWPPFDGPLKNRSIGWECDPDNRGVRVTKTLFVRNILMPPLERYVLEEGETYTTDNFIGGVPVLKRTRVKNEARCFAPRVINPYQDVCLLFTFDARNTGNWTSPMTPVEIYAYTEPPIIPQKGILIGETYINSLTGGQIQTIQLLCNPYHLEPGEYILGIVIDGDVENVPFQEEYKLIIKDPFSFSKHR